MATSSRICPSCGVDKTKEQGEHWCVHPSQKANPTISSLTRIMDRAHKYAITNGADYEGLAKVYENAVFKELADLTRPRKEEEQPE